MMDTRSLRQLEKLLLRCTGEAMARFGFRARPRGQTFQRPISSGCWMVHLSFMEHEHDFDVTADLAVRHDEVEAIANATKAALSKREKELTATLGVELGNLADGRQRRWTVASVEDVTATVPLIVREFENFGLPFLKRFTDLHATLGVLATHDRAATLYSPIHAERCRRVVALAHILEGKGGAEGAAAKCTDYLRSRGDPGLLSFERFAHHLFDDRTTRGGS